MARSTSSAAVRQYGWVAFLVAPLVAGLLAGRANTGFAQPGPVPADSTLPDLEEGTRTGMLDNGLRYYIRQNDEPKDRLVLRLVINAGSVLERDDEEGIAHFLEHMLFNGTEQFPEQELVDFLERTGMEFGPDVNASTSFDETVYKLRLPTDTTGLVETGVEVLGEWAQNATLQSDAIEDEKGVVLSEYRSRYESAGGRMFFETFPTLLNGSPYAQRLPIGDTSDVKAFTPEQVRGFYERWYRPELMAVVAVGDADVDALEQQIRREFADLPARPEAEVRPTVEVPGHDSTRFAVVTDPEFPVSVVRVHHKADAEPLETVGDYRRQLHRSLFFDMLNSRMQEKVRNGEVPFLGASGSSGGLVRTERQAVLSAQVPDDSVTAGLEALLTEVERVRQHGFTATELARAKQNLRSRYESAYNDRANRSSGGLAGSYANHFLSGAANPGIDYEWELVQRLLPAIGREDIHDQTRDLFDPANRVVVVQMPEKDDLTPPTSDTLAKVLDRVRDRETEPYEDDATDLPLVASVPDTADVTDRTTNDSLGTTTLTLENGVRVVVKPTDFSDDEVRVVATSPGGLAMVPDSLYATAQFANAVVSRSGVGAFTQTALKKKLSGKNVRVSPYIGSDEEGLQGRASPNDLETLFQLMHLYVTEPRGDSVSLTTFQRQARAYLQNRSKQPAAVFQDSLRAALYGDHPRRQAPEMEDVNRLQADELLQIYRDRFAGVGDMTVTVVGNASVDSIETLARTYLGTLPGGEGTEEVPDVLPNPPDRFVDVNVSAGIAQRSRVLLLYHGPMTYDRENRHRLRTLKDLLSIELREELRENRSGVYNVGVNHNTSGAPDPRYSLSVSFVSDPSRADELTDAARAVIDSVRSGHVSSETAAKVKEQQRRSRETSLEENSFWVSALDFTLTTPGEDPMDIFRYGELIDGVTPESVSETAREYLLDDRMVEATLRPGSAEAGASSSEAESESEK